jgi:Zn-dependent peptidase ImmA (M78 family)
MSKVAVSKQILRWAAERSGLTMDKLQKKFPHIQAWMGGDGQPTLHQLETLANLTLTPLGFFFLAEPPVELEKLPMPHFRTIDNNQVDRPSPDLLDTAQLMQQRQEWMREHMIDQGEQKLPFVRSAKLTDTPVSVANSIRQTLGFDEQWASSYSTWTDALNALREATESVGILVSVNGVVGNNTHRKLDPDEFRGFVLVDEYAPLIFINGSDFKAAQMFTIAHELAHVFIGKSAAFDLHDLMPAHDRSEQFCNQIAAEFLVPENRFRQSWPRARNTSNPFQELARIFKVSELVIGRRALDLGLISKQKFFDFYQEYMSKERESIARKPSGGDFYSNQNFRIGRRFAAAVIRAAREGKLLYSNAYHLTGLRGKTFDRYASSLGLASK